MKNLKHIKLFESYNENDYETLLKIVKDKFDKPGQITIDYKDVKILLETSINRLDMITYEFSVVGDDNLNFGHIDTNYYSDDDFKEIVELFEEVYDDYKFNIKAEAEMKELIKKGYKRITHKHFKYVLKNILPDWCGHGTSAMSGSEYILFSGHNLRFADHMRPPTSKWNFIHGENHIDVLDGIFKTEKKFVDWFDKKTDNKLDNNEKNKIREYFKTIKN